MKAMERACRWIEDCTGSCPMDQCNHEPWDLPCETVCDVMTKQLWRCWEKYFRNLEERNESSN